MANYVGLSKPVLINDANANVDYLYGPYDSVSAACTAIAPSLRKIGKTVGITDNTGVTEYWFESGIKDSDLIPKFLDTHDSYLSIDESIDTFLIDMAVSTKSYVKLNDNKSIHYITIKNYVDGSYGELIIEQSSNKSIAFTNVEGVFNMPSGSGNKLYIKYFVNGAHIFGYSQQIFPLGFYNNPQQITDLTVVYYDSQLVQLRWTAPHGNLATDTVTGYDIRYSNSLLSDPDAVWLSLKQTTSPIPSSPGEEEDYVIANLPSNQEYYIYIKSYQVIYGVKYSSNVSGFAYCKTSSNDSTDPNVPYRIRISPDQIHVQGLQPASSTSDNFSIPDNMVDETEKNVFLSTGYPDLTNKSFSTYWKEYMYGRGTAYFRIIIDLYQVYNLDKLFLYSGNMGKFSVYYISKLGDSPIKLTENSTTGNIWVTINFNNTKVRFVVLQYDLQQFCGASTNPNIPVDSYGIPNPYYNWDLGQINNLLLYGKSTTGIPDGIHNPLMKSTVNRYIKDYLNTNGHFYQSGKLHSLVSGPYVRLYGHPGQFCPFNNAGVLQIPQTISDTKYRLNNISWVSSNGPSSGFISLLTDTYKPYGLKPFITATGVMDIVRLVWNNTKWDAAWQVDDNCYPGLTPPLPKNSKEGLKDFLGVVANPNNYKVYSKWAYAMAAKFGKVNDDINAPRYIWSSPDYPNPEPMTTGLDLLSGIEPENEEDKTWVGMSGFHLPEQVSALCGACYDGNQSHIIDDTGKSDIYGLKNIDPNFKLVMGGLANGTKSGYLLYTYLNSIATRTDNQLPFDSYNAHLYFSNQGIYQSSREQDFPSTYAVSPETLLAKEAFVGGALRKSINVRNIYTPTKEFWITEFGYGESGARNSYSRYQCYSIAGKNLDGWIIPDRHRSDVKGNWTVRAALNFLELGVEQCNTYITYGESEWWDSNTGAGQEMFRWDELTDETPGAKVAAIAQYEPSNARSGFNSFGFFGHPIYDGGYPISRSFWYIALFRNTLGNFKYIGKLKLDAFPNIQIFCFKNPETNKGAYAVYYNDSINTGQKDVIIPIPDNNETVDIITEYIPKLPDPEVISNRLGTDQLRTGLPTARHEKYTNGQWVIQNLKPDGVNWESFAQGSASYPINPVEGDEVVVLPTSEENPYFPIVGPVCAKASGYTGTRLGANQYDYPTIIDGDTVWESKYNSKLIWRQSDAIYDYVKLSSEGIKGTNGVATTINTKNNTITTNVSEFVKYIIFNGDPVVSCTSTVTNLSSVAINSTSIKLFWNNVNTDDTKYEIFMSSLPESGYSKYSEVLFGNNNIIIDGLTPDTVYYFKVRPVKGLSVGIFSSYISAKPYSFIPNIENLNSNTRTNSSITLSWDYSTDSISNFYGFYIYRDSGNGIYSIVGTIVDQNIHTFVDTGLLPGTYYSYKVRAIGLNGQSDFTPVFTIRTLTVEESAPVLLSAETDKLGTKIILVFNVPLSTDLSNSLNAFSLTENGNSRLISSLTVDVANQNRLFINFPDGTLSDYTKGYLIKISYTPTDIYYITSAYNIKATQFLNISVSNRIGNFINLNAKYRINFASSDYIAPTNLTDIWNNLLGSPESAVIKLDTLYDTDNVQHGISIYNYYSPLGKSWGGGTLLGGKYIGLDVPKEIYESGWNCYYTSNSTENFTAKLFLSGLTVSNSYKVILYGSGRNISVGCKIKVNGIYSNTIEENNNTSNFITLDNITPSSDGTLLIEIITVVSSTIKTSASVNFMYIEEYFNESNPPSTDVYIKSLAIDENIDNTNTVTTNSIHITPNIIGVATQYKISTLPDLSDATWVSFSGKIPYVIPGDFGSKTVYVGLKNDTSESNIKAITVTYKDPYVPLVLKNIYINDDAASTTDSNIKVFFSIDGIPTHYRIAESSTTLTSMDWTSWGSPSDFKENFVMSSGAGQKTIYAQVKDSKTISDIKVDTITFIDIVTAILNSVVINNGDAEAPSGTVSVAIDTTNTITKYKIGQQSNLSDCPSWITWTGSPVTYASGITSGSFTVYVKVGNDTTESDIKSDSITIATPIEISKLSISGDDASFEGYTVPVEFMITSGTPTHYKLAESLDLLNSMDWVVWPNPGLESVNYTFGSSGNKTLYGQLKNSVSESTIRSSSITILAPSVAAIFGFNYATSGGITTVLDGSNYINQLGFTANTTNPRLQLKDTSNQPLSWYINQNTTTYYAANSIFATAGANLAQYNIDSSTAAGNFALSSFRNGKVPNENALSVSGRLSISLPVGTYRMDILSSPPSTYSYTEAMRQSLFFSLYNGTTLITESMVSQSSGFTGVGNNDFNCSLTFTLASDTTIDLRAWSKTVVAYYRPHINLVRITKTA